MNVFGIEVPQDGELEFDSIFDLESSMNITVLIDKCDRAGCRLHFKNEDITFGPDFDTMQRANLMVYGFLMSNPKPLRDYINYLLDKADRKAPGE